MIIDVGPKTSDVVLSWENLYAYNRKFLDPVSDRYFFVENPIELTVKHVPQVFVARLRLHPDKRERGFREYAIKPVGDDDFATFWVSKKDIDVSKVGSMVRLMELFNVEIKKADTYSADASFISESYEKARGAKAQLIHWIPVGEDIPCQVVMPDATLAEGIAESVCKRLRPNDIVQFERFGFVRIDKINMKLTAYYAHK